MNKKYLLRGLLSVILWGLLLRRCDNNKYREITDEKLKPTEKTAIIINDRGEVTTITRDSTNGNGICPSSLRGRNSQSSPVSTETIKRTDGAKDIRISIDSRGNVSYTFRTWGFQFSPEAGICYASNGDSRLILNDQFFFYKKHSLNFGLGRNFNSKNIYRLHLAYGYTPKTKYFSNSSFLVGIDTDKKVLVGVTIGF